MARLKLSLVVSISQFILLAFNLTALGQTKTPQPDEILRNMAERYSSISSYEDSGVVETVTDGPLVRRNTDIYFKTYFTRPNKLRFEWLNCAVLVFPDRSILWSDGSKSFTSHAHSPGRIETKDDLGMAVAGATGVSLGSAHTVPTMLIKELLGFVVTDIKKPILKGQEAFEGEECYVVEGLDRSDQPVQLWISRQDSLLRKLRQPGIDGEFEEEIHRNIKVNANLPDVIYQPKFVAGHIVNTIEKEKEDAINRLLEIVHPRDRVNQQLSDVITLMKQAMPQVPEKTWKEVFTEVQFDSDGMLKIYVPLYDSHFTGEEIKQLIQFFQTPLGRKFQTSAELIEIESMLRGREIGQELLKKVQERLRAKGYKAAD